MMHERTWRPACRRTALQNTTARCRQRTRRAATSSPRLPAAQGGVECAQMGRQRNTHRSGPGKCPRQWSCSAAAVAMDRCGHGRPREHALSIALTVHVPGAVPITVPVTVPVTSCNTAGTTASDQCMAARSTGSRGPARSDRTARHMHACIHACVADGRRAHGGAPVSCTTLHDACIACTHTLACTPPAPGGPYAP